MNGRSMSVEMMLESSILALSAASLRRVIAVLSFLRSIPVLDRKSPAIRLTMA